MVAVGARDRRSEASCTAAERSALVFIHGCVRRYFAHNLMTCSPRDVTVTWVVPSARCAVVIR
jgi:hypothetical protein